MELITPVFNNVCWLIAWKTGKKAEKIRHFLPGKNDVIFFTTFSKLKFDLENYQPSIFITYPKLQVSFHEIFRSLLPKNYISM